MNDLPPPLVPADVDLRNFADLSLEVMRVRDSDLRRLSTGDEFKAAILLWCAAWHQVPAGSLPDSDVELADLASIGTGRPAVRAFQKVKEMALRGWVKCRGHVGKDGREGPPRLYHPRMALKAMAAWKNKRSRAEGTLKARLASLAKAIKEEKDPNRKAVLQVEHDKLLREIQQTLSPPVSPPLSQGVPQALALGAVQGELGDLSQPPLEESRVAWLGLDSELRTPPPSPDVSPRDAAAATQEEHQGERPADPQLAVVFDLGGWMSCRGQDLKPEWLAAIDGQDIDQIRDVMAFGRAKTGMAVHFPGPTGYEGHRKALAEERRAQTREARETKRRAEDAARDAEQAKEGEKHEAEYRAQVGALVAVFREDPDGWSARMTSEAAVALGRLRIAHEKGQRLGLLIMTQIRHLPVDLVEQAKARAHAGAQPTGAVQ